MIGYRKDSVQKIFNVPWEQIVSLGQQTMLNQQVFSVSWILGRFCNYACSYCWPYAHSNTPDFQDFDIYTQTIDSIKAQARQNKFNRFHWSFSGGEPTAYKKLLELIAYLPDNLSDYQSLHMTTNLSAGTQWWNRWIDASQRIQRRSLTASYHHEHADEDEFADKCVMLNGLGVFVTVNQVMVPAQFYQLYARCEKFAAKGINVTLKPQSNQTATSIVDGYTHDMIQLMQQGFPQKFNEHEVYQISLSDRQGNTYQLDQAERLNAFDFNKFQGWSCASGYQSVIIRGNEVKRGYSCKDSILGTLDKGFELFRQPEPCITERCVSSADNKIPKCKLI